jgi:hypothetical protein
MSSALNLLNDSEEESAYQLDTVGEEKERRSETNGQPSTEALVSSCPRVAKDCQPVKLEVVGTVGEEGDDDSPAGGDLTAEGHEDQVSEFAHRTNSRRSAPKTEEEEPGADADGGSPAGRDLTAEGHEHQGSEFAHGTNSLPNAQTTHVGEEEEEQADGLSPDRDDSVEQSNADSKVVRQDESEELGSSRIDDQKTEGKEIRKSHDIPVAGHVSREFGSSTIEEMITAGEKEHELDQAGSDLKTLDSLSTFSAELGSSTIEEMCSAGEEEDELDQAGSDLKTRVMYGEEEQENLEVRGTSVPGEDPLDRENDDSNLPKMVVEDAEIQPPESRSTVAMTNE